MSGEKPYILCSLGCCVLENKSNTLQVFSSYSSELANWKDVTQFMFDLMNGDEPNQEISESLSAFGWTLKPKTNSTFSQTLYIGKYVVGTVWMAYWPALDSAHNNLTSRPDDDSEQILNGAMR